MLSKACQTAATLAVAACLLWGFSAMNAQAMRSASLPIGDAGAPASTGVVYNQPPSPGGGLFQSSLLEPDGSAADEWVWDDFTLGAAQTISEIQWRGGYKFGLGGPVIGFTLKIYPTNQTGFEPDVAHPPLVGYTLSHNAGETPADILGGVQTYDYHYALPVHFQAAAGTKYWVQIEGIQQGGAGFTPDWALSRGLGGDVHHFRRCCNGGIYQPMTGDTAFTLLGPIVPIGNLSVTNNSPTALGQMTTFTATVASGSNVVYEWDFGDGAFDSGSVVMHAFSAVGFYTAIVTASNSISLITATTPVAVFGDLPLAIAGPDQTVWLDTEVMLDGSGSFAVPGRLPLTYGWQQLGGEPVVLSSAVISRPTFIAPAQPTIITFTLTVTDTLGLGSEPDLVQIKVSRNYPVYLPLVTRTE